MIPLLDADALISLSQSDGKLLLLNSSEVLDLVVSECHNPKYCNAHQFIEQSSLSVIVADPSWLQEASCYRSPSLSFHDILNLHYASSCQRTLVTNSKCLMSVCNDKHINTISYHEFLETFALN
ncbi:hypothetical protein C7B77_00055 [Chamaesiphon polymorphus CCALA 037]|uniref:PIN domain-containing protein n=1 Tax=Chamaesiphon polymorphus CCALA 037 TaxID=2107692 RepID=A0A2T1GNW4_9CYAN|nr:hypothetical protein C7B77_00055 [Chamaesiphon polymorphus CCALA 037]